ncbi:MAG: hypothetical protein ABJJ53_19195 [Sulfitobacter sp.]
MNQTFTDALLGLEPIKTWSLIVTMFGDLRGDAMTGKQLRALLEPLGVKPEATRVALHRLKNDGWISATKTGREVTYSLSQFGKEQTNAVSPDIYRQSVKYPDGWSVLVTDDNAIDNGVPEPYIKIGRNIAVLPTASKTGPKASITVAMPNADAPVWLQNRIVEQAILDLALGLAPLAEIAQSQIHKISVLDRIILLHHWRKMALRPHCWAHIDLVPNGPIAKCHQHVTQILADTDQLDLAADR